MLQMVLDVERGVPSIPLALLSVDWSRGGVLPPGCVAPSLDEFLVDIRGHDPLVVREGGRGAGRVPPEGSCRLLNTCCWTLVLDHWSYLLCKGLPMRPSYNLGEKIALSSIHCC
jgi:hypothetical protein